MHLFKQSALARRPAWMALVLALPFGVLVNTWIGGWDSLPGALLMLMGWAHEPTLWQRWVVKTLCHIVVPWAVAYGVLRITRLSDWLVPNRLALAALIAADALFCGYAVWSLTMAWVGDQPYMRGAANRWMTGLVIGCLGVGLSSLAASTVWHRLVKHKDRAKDHLAALVREV